MSKLVLKKDEMVLLKNSEAAKNSEMYGNLYHVVQPYITLTESEFQHNLLFDDKARSVILNNKKILINEIKDEWRSIGSNDETTNEIHCQLCGRKNKYIFYIQNKINGIELNVGSECIKNYPGLQDLNIHKRSLNEKIKLQAENRRKIQFDEIDLDSLNYIKNSEKWFTNFKILLPHKLYNDIKTTLHNLNSLRTIYIKQGGKIENIKKQYYELKNSLETYKREAEDIYISTKSNPLICQKALSDWLKSHHSDIWEKVLLNDGYLNKDTLKYCYYSKFVENNLHKFNSKLSDKDIQIIGMNGNLIRFAIKNSDYLLPLHFDIKCDIFMFNIGCHCLTDTDYSFGKESLSLTNSVSIEQNSNSFNAISNRLIKPLHIIGLSIEKSEATDEIYYVRLPQIIAKSPSGNHVKTSELGYKKIPSSSLYDIMNLLIFKSDDAIKKRFETILVRLNSSTKPWMTKKEKDDYEAFSKSLTIQNQKEFVPYT